MTQLKITFEKGGAFVASLLEQDAPKTCRFIIEHLPFTCTFHHSTTSGEAIVCLPKNMTPQPENQRTVGIYPGALCYLVNNPAMRVPDEIYITYGPYFIPRGFRVDYQEPVNVFGQIESGLDELAKIGDRLLEQGMEKVTFELVS